jgi:hypothetical protein
MNYRGMEPEEHLKFVLNAVIEQTGQRRYLKKDLRIYNNLNYGELMPQNMSVRMESEIAVKMGERDYEKFIYSYGKYLDLLHAVETDPIAKEMFEKLLVYIHLKH